MEAAWGCRPAAAAPLHVARQARAHVPLVRHASPAWHSCRVAACGAAKATFRATLAGVAKGVTQ
jgi:hypothetical protein